MSHRDMDRVKLIKAINNHRKGMEAFLAQQKKEEDLTSAQDKITELEDVVQSQHDELNRWIEDRFNVSITLDRLRKERDEAQEEVKKLVRMNDSTSDRANALNQQRNEAIEELGNAKDAIAMMSIEIDKYKNLARTSNILYEDEKAALLRAEEDCDAIAEAGDNYIAKLAKAEALIREVGTLAAEDWTHGTGYAKQTKPHQLRLRAILSKYNAD